MVKRNFKAPTSKLERIAFGAVIATVVLGAAIGWRLSSAMATPPPGAPSAPAAPAAPAEPAAPAPPAAPAAPAAPTAPGVAAAAAATPASAPATAMPTTSQIMFTTVPPAHASVMWGKTLLGRIAPRQPLIVVRPRDSGPLDVTVRAAGYLPVHTRAHTFSDTKIAVKLTTPDQKNTLFGYRAPLDAGMPLDETLTAPPPAGTDLLQQPPL